jgi:hypothetical protein
LDAGDEKADRARHDPDGATPEREFFTLEAALR